MADEKKPGTAAVEAAKAAAEPEKAKTEKLSRVEKMEKKLDEIGRAHV